MDDSGSYMDVFISPSTQQYISGNFMVGDWLRHANAKFWRTELWLPNRVSWDDIDSSASEIWYYPMLFGFVFMFLRYCIIQPFIFVPIARARCIPNKRTKKPEPNKTLETLYQKYQTELPQAILTEASESTHMSIRKVERWLRRRYGCVKLNRYDKFLDCSFKLVCHIVFGIMGLAMALPKPYLWNTVLCYEDFSNQKVPSDLWFYHMIILGYYWAITIEELPKPGGKGSDKMQMIVHHVITIFLTAYAYTVGQFRIGGLIMFIHEYSDIALLAAKTCHYAGYDAPTEPLFIAFVILWILTRCVILPFWLMRSVFFEMPSAHLTPAMIVLKVWMIMLLFLTAFWTKLVMKTVSKKLSGQGLQDVRSATEESTDADNVKED